MTQNDLTDALAEIRYQLRHTAITEDFVEWLEDRLQILRIRYRRNRAEFKSGDILFLQHLGFLITTLHQYLTFERRLAAIKRGRQLSNEFAKLSERIIEMREESFSLVARQCVALHDEVVELYRAPKQAIEASEPTTSQP